jgi:hypothetical protein
MNGKEHEMYALFARFLGQESSSDSFSPATLFMSTSLTRFQDRIEKEFERPGIAPWQYPMTKSKAFAQLLSEDAGRFLFEVSVPMHEKKHFIDIVSTTFCHDVFVSHWNAVNSFHQAVTSIPHLGLRVKLPLRK